MGQREDKPRKSAEYSGKTEEEALSLASQDLGIPPEELEYQVIRDRTRSFLGLVRTGEVTIRIWLPAEERPAAPAAPAAPEVASQQVVTQTAAPTPAVEAEPSPGVQPAAPEAQPKVVPSQLESVAMEVVSTLLDKMGVLAAVEVVDRGGQKDPQTGEESPLVLNVVGDELGSLIGRRGETLRDLQFIVRLIISHRLGEWPNVVVDVESYKARREETLRALALRMGDQVRKTGRPVVLEPMPAHERRIVHLALRDDPDVYTESTGEEDHRKVQILPR